MHNNGAGEARTFPELWNSASASLAGRFRIERRHRGLEEMLESGVDESRCDARAGRLGSGHVIHEIPP
ncbi:hypothetical protein [Burkholderia sp. A2]|uniref:hypothetical protein n=1 Tax=Burkholderia sp. A2 TaxID=236253 RepID=UPI00159F1606|nr:hypothetical protein [Burkholderia sp. A2]